MISKNFLNNNNRHRIKLLLILCLFGFCLVQAMQSPKKRAKCPQGDRVLPSSCGMSCSMICLVVILMRQIVKGKVLLLHQGVHLLVTVPIFIKNQLG